jgi:hypothetical protein
MAAAMTAGSTCTSCPATTASRSRSSPSTRRQVLGRLDGYVTAVGERRFVNLRLAAADAGLLADVAKSGHEDSHPYSFAAYAFDGDDVLSVAYPQEALYKAVKEGRLAGETSGDYDVFIGDSSANIAAVLGALDEAALFNQPKQYKRCRRRDRTRQND